ncbi:3-hydroxyacyl-CoA dehydrogenase [Gluconacetobacter azotocaptans]|uniref:3-hydroxyacyl-CoA dehydrogenase n=1 Tax=Gluconacetobacter azotocaptans TaxID=142834 RepID=UPI0019582D05|nr:3-hydroxyacyl-CoA dehydrogenase [Gluconacetobacter azotocaptans]MBM9402591.1 3-hydroxyacyl-CoA dehydrogenase [Gluconacetobacter azotocaptans]
MKNIALVGCGLVGGSWALVFSRAGFDVTLYDPSPTAVQTALDVARNAAETLARQDLLHAERVEDVLARLRPAPSLAEAVRNADYIQESAPERLAVKQEVYRDLAVAAGPDAVIASSTSGLPASAFTAGIPGRARCVVAHPINPPHLIPLVEIIPAPWTDPSVVARTHALMQAVGQVPIQLSREIPGFVVNRLQSAVLAEGFRLVEDGICSPDDVDAAMSDGLGLRWFFMGPFETIDLNAQGGIADYCRKLGPMYYDLARQQADPRPWSEALVARVEAARRGRTPAADLDARKAWRDRCLARLVRTKREIVQDQE